MKSKKKQSGHALASEHAGEVAGQTTYRQGSKPPSDRKVAKGHDKKTGVVEKPATSNTGNKPRALRQVPKGHSKPEAPTQSQSKYRKGLRGY